VRATRDQHILLSFGDPRWAFNQANFGSLFVTRIFERAINFSCQKSPLDLVNDLLANLTCLCTVTPLTDSPPNLPPADVAKHIPCRFFALGSCKYGSSCHFNHEFQSNPPNPTISMASPQPNSNGQVNGTGGVVYGIGPGGYAYYLPQPAQGWNGVAVGGTQFGFVAPPPPPPPQSTPGTNTTPVSAPTASTTPDGIVVQGFDLGNPQSSPPQPQQQPQPQSQPQPQFYYSAPIPPPLPHATPVHSIPVATQTQQGYWSFSQPTPYPYAHPLPQQQTPGVQGVVPTGVIVGQESPQRSISPGYAVYAPVPQGENVSDLIDGFFLQQLK
jgi:hypothetical protein